jgi:tetratricopeptide (TPR) repeat protein
MPSVGWCERAPALHANAPGFTLENMSSDEPGAEAHNNLGNTLFDRGRVAEAIHSYRQALQIDPNYADAHNNLGIALHAQGQLDEAISSFRQALRVNPNYANALNNLGNALRQQGELAEAISCYRQVLGLSPHHALAHNNLGIALVEQGEVAEAIDCYRQALRIHPNYVNALNNLGAALNNNGQPTEAEDCFRQALRMDPNYVSALNNLGMTLRKKGRLAEAVACHRHALRTNLNDADTHYYLGSALAAGEWNDPGVALGGQGHLAEGAWNDLGVALGEGGDLTEAARCYRQALRINPNHALAHNNLGNVLVREGQLAEATESFRAAVRLDPQYADGLCNLGLALKFQGRLDEAAACFEQALSHHPDHPASHAHRALLRLLQGDFKEGWPEYEFRWTQLGLAERHADSPRWDGSPLADKTILVHAEQGLGDTIHFIRYAPLVKERAGTVLFECQAPLVHLLKGSAGIDQLVARGAPLPPFDVQIPLLSVPTHFTTSLAAIPANIPYLRADAERIASWGKELAPWSGFRIGIAWQGNATFRDDKSRSFPLKLFEAIASVEGVRLLSLQKGAGSDQINGLEGRFAVLDLGDRLDAEGAFIDTAAIMMHLDLIVTVDSAAAHLAGALGVPVWVAVPFAPDWRWLLGREGSPWYPTMRLFRQKRPGDWGEVFERMAREIGRMNGK